MALFAHFDLFPSVHGEGAAQTGLCAVIGIIHPCIQTTKIDGDSPRPGEQ
jgi:hypothetical protein